MALYTGLRMPEMFGNVLSQSLAGMAAPAAQSASQAAPAAGAGAMPAVMTPSEAAQFLRVSEEDIVAAITAGELKARKIGSAYRITKEALEAYLSGS